jgi:hypothetical protein
MTITLAIATLLATVALTYLVPLLPRPAWLTPRRVLLLFALVLTLASALAWASVAVS